VGRGSDTSRRVPNQVELCRLRDGVAFGVNFILTGRLVLALGLGLLLEDAFESVAILEEPCALALRFVVLKVALEVNTVGIDPLARLKLAAGPLAAHFHASFLEDVGAVALLLAVFPPAGVDITVFVSEHALAMATAVFPVTVVLTNVIVGHLADAALDVLFPAALVTMDRLIIAIDTSA